MMSLMEWQSNLDVGVETMNNQHRQILDLMNALHDSSEKQEGFDRQLEILDQLAKVTISHFAEEEKFMESSEFPGFAAHREIHKQLLEKLQVHINLIKSERKIGVAFFGFLKLWLSAHIKGIDKKYGEHYNSKKVA